MRRGWHPVLEIPALAAVALLCAWISNRAASPTRRLSWLPQRTTLPLVEPAPPMPIPAPAVSTQAATSPAKQHLETPAKAKQPPPPESADWDPAALLARYPPLKDQPYVELDGDEARWLQLHGALILDARRSEVYAAGHILGARCLPVWEDGLSAKIAALQAAKADPLLPTIVYCAGGDCEDSHILAQKLWMAGFRNLRVYTGGYPDWTARGWPVSRGEAP
ncbi:MAG TPA: rhodanese-like domain-containing protein [Holophagaceae bacterium]|jgi:rhodanese-related sulfurtransferase|nr:rhodanese-like domain-containing protein [Holophagaceae bacterium]